MGYLPPSNGFVARIDGVAVSALDAF